VFVTAATRSRVSLRSFSKRRTVSSFALRAHHRYQAPARSAPSTAEDARIRSELWPYPSGTPRESPRDKSVRLNGYPLGISESYNIELVFTMDRYYQWRYLRRQELPSPV